jgi:DMSO/TMAO reductase YedYZ molybdopterin-dependent catalytic subunit
MSQPLPPGQFEADGFHRFGLGKFAKRFPAEPDQIAFEVRGDVAHKVQVGSALQALPRVEQTSDFHCVTTWSVRKLHWSGYRFSDFYQRIVQPEAQPEPGAEWVVFHGQDDYRCAMQLEDLLATDVLLADRVNDAPLGLEHGAPLRLVAPAHYGYKNVKHIGAIEFCRDRRQYRFPFPYPRFMDHPRARVALAAGLPTLGETHRRKFSKNTRGPPEPTGLAVIRRPKLNQATENFFRPKL